MSPDFSGAPALAPYMLVEPQYAATAAAHAAQAPPAVVAPAPVRPYFCLAPSFGVVPQRALLQSAADDNGYFADDDAVWSALLAKPRIGTKEGSCIRGSVFNPTALHPVQLNVDELHGLVLDVDEFDHRPIALEAARATIAQRLHGVRHIAWTTYNSSPLTPRYRVILPLARPVPRRKYRALWELVNKDLGYIVGEGQWNADRLGYMPRLPNEGARLGYRAWINQGPYLDAEVRYGTLPETPDTIFLGSHAAHAQSVDTSNFLPEAEALGRARAYMKDAHLGVKAGSRHMKLFEKSCQLWWDFWLERENVLTVLAEINARFEQPKAFVDVQKEVEAGFGWTRGDGARPQKVEAGHSRQRPPPVTLNALVALGKRVKRRAGQQELGTALIALGSREPYADAEHVLHTTRLLARAVGEEYPRSDPAQAAVLFWHSLAIVRAQAAHLWPQQLGQTPQATVDVVKNLIMQKQHETKAQLTHEEDAKKRELQERIAIGTGGRNTPFTQEEIIAFAAQQRCTVEELKHRLVLGFGPSYFFFRGDGGYSPPVEHAVAVYASTALAGFEPWGIETYVGEGEDRKLRAAEEIVDHYGTVADIVRYSFIEQRSHYDATTRTLVQAAAPLRPVRAERIPEVEEYLSLALAQDALLDWLAFAPRLDRAARILYLKGAPDTGKSFFAHCISRLWSTNGPTTGEMLFGDFNEAAKNPCVLCDEILPPELRGRRGTELLRRITAALTHEIRAKFRRSVPLDGAFRWIFCANNLRLIETDDTLTPDDVEGIRQRVDVVELTEAAGKFLRSLGYERTKRWIEDDLVVKHVLWLSETRELPPLGRFGPEQRERRDVMQTTQLWSAQSEVFASARFGGTAGSVMEWIYNDVTRFSSQHLKWGRNGATTDLFMLVSLDELIQQWEMVLGLNAKRPTRPKLLEGLKAARTALVRSADDSKRYHAVDISALEEWARLVDVDLHDLAAKVRSAQEKKVVHFYREEGT